MKFFALCLLASCAALEPDYVEVSPFYADGSSAGRYANMPAYSADEDTVGLMVTVGWAVGQMGEAYRNLSMLDVSKGGELTLRDPGPAGVTVNVEDDEPEPEPAADDDDDADDGKWTKPPRTMDEAWAYLIWAFGVLVLAYAAKKWGVPALRLYRDGKKGGPSEKPEPPDTPEAP